VVDDIVLPTSFFGAPYPLVNIQKAIENGHRNIGFTQLENGDFL